MTIGVYTLEFHLPMARSLKDRRQVVRRLKDRLRARHNVAVSEQPQHADLWQRFGLIVVSIATNRDPLDRLFDTVQREAESLVPGQIIDASREFLDAEEGGPVAWTEDAS